MVTTLWNGLANVTRLHPLIIDHGDLSSSRCSSIHFDTWRRCSFRWVHRTAEKGAGTDAIHSWQSRISARFIAARWQARLWNNFKVSNRIPQLQGVIMYRPTGPSPLTVVVGCWRRCTWRISCHRSSYWSISMVFLMIEPAEPVRPVRLPSAIITAIWLPLCHNKLCMPTLVECSEGTSTGQLYRQQVACNISSPSRAIIGLKRS